MSNAPSVERPEPATGRSTSATETGSVFVSNYPPYSFWTEEAVGEAVQSLRVAPDTETALGLYLHIPFCRKRCKFCYFRVYTDKKSADVLRYADALGTELELYAKLPRLGGRKPRFIYFGGGTPSYISARHLRDLVVRLQGAISWEEAEEVAFECEPGTLTETKVEAIKEIGVTRLSLGVENLDDEILRENGRAHVSKEVYQVIPWIKAQSFEQLNIDLIAGMVGESWDRWRETVQRTIDLDPDSITVYQMELPYNTVYSQQANRVAVADWATKRSWHEYAFEQFERAGYQISSAYTVARKGRAHRFIYRDALWQGADMIGAGVASFSHIAGIHLQNRSNWDEYLEALEQGELPVGRAFRTTDDERLTRELILQLKLGEVRKAYFMEKFNCDIVAKFGPVIDQLTNEAMLRCDGEILELSRAGLLRVDELLPRFYDPKYTNARYT